MHRDSTPSGIQVTVYNPWPPNQGAIEFKTFLDFDNEFGLGAGTLPESVELRQVKYLNTLIEQDHRFIKRLVKAEPGFFSVETARRTLQGNEVMSMICKGQVRGVGKGDITGQVAFIASLFGVAA
jgi:hypothetical protein